MAASYRHVIDTKPSRFLKRIRNINWVESRIENRKKPNGPNLSRNRNAENKKNPHTFPTLKHLNLGRLMRCNVCEKYEPFCKKKKMTAEIQFVSYATSSGQKRQLLRRKLCTNINQPYLIWAAVLCHVPPPKNQ